MHRRARHLNPRFLGATLFLDARYITGLSDGNSIATWPDKGPNAWDASQATATSQPTYKTSIQGGNPVARFDGGDNIFRVQNLTPGQQGVLTMIVLASFNNNTSKMCAFDAKRRTSVDNNIAIEQNTDGTAGSRYGLYTSASGLDSDISTSSGMKIFSVDCLFTNGTTVASNTNYRINGVPATLTLKTGAGTYFGQTGVGGYMLGSRMNSSFPTAGTELTGDIASVAVTETRLSTPCIKRLEQAASLSYKIACS